MTIYGIPNCDTVQKALAWLNRNQVPYVFHNFRKDGISAEKLASWEKIAGLERIINKKSATWRGLTDEQREGLSKVVSAWPVLQEKSSLIRRPVIEDGDFLFFGFDEDAYRQHFLR